MRFLLYNIKYGTNSLGRWSWLSFMTRSTRHFMTVERFIDCVQPDVIGLVEIDSGSYRTRGNSQVDHLASTFGYHQAARAKYHSAGLAAHLPILRTQSNAILSKEPFQRAVYHDFSVGMKRLVIEVELEKVCIFLVHLALGATTRHHQLEELHHLIKSANKPCILAGDFNFLAGKWESHLFLDATGLIEANAAHRPTYPSWRPKRLLDFVCHSPEIRLKRFRMPRLIVSDHLPMVCDFEFN